MVSEPMRRRILVGGAILIVGILAWYGWQWLTEGRFQRSTDNAYIEADISVVAPKVAGYVRAVPVRDNQPVKRGDILLVIDDADYQARLAEARSGLEAALAAQATARADIARQGAEVDQAQADIAAAQATWSRAGQDLARYRKLSKAQYASVQRMESAQAEEAQTRAQLASAHAGLQTATSELGVVRSRLKQSDASVQQARARLAQAQLDVDNTILRAAIDGVIGNRQARPGQYVRAGTQAMAIVPTGQLYVLANFKETQIDGIRLGQSVRVDVDAYPDAQLTGRVESLSPAAGSRFALLPPENATGNFTRVVARVPVRIALDPSDLRGLHLGPGMSVIAVVDTRSRQGSSQE